MSFDSGLELEWRAASGGLQKWRVCMAGASSRTVTVRYGGQRGRGRCKVQVKLYARIQF